MSKSATELDKDAEIARLQDALTDHNLHMRSAYNIAVREAETPMTTRWEGCIKTWLEVLTKHHAVTNDAREASWGRKANQSEVTAKWHPIETAPQDGTRILLAKIVGHPDHPTALWWVTRGFWSEKWNNWNDGVEPAGLADPTHWMAADAHGCGDAAIAKATLTRKEDE